jgi:SAM-dependent methyltransferase
MADQSTTAEARNAELPEYGPAYFQNYWGGAGPYERNERWLRFFGDVADGIVRDLHPTSSLDAGCAMGFLVEALASRGVDSWGIDLSEYAISQVDESVRDRCRVGSLTEPLDRRYDLITCIEVIEHVPPAETETVIANLCQATDQLLLSTTPQDFGEPTHLNVQPPEYWSAALARNGFLRDVDRDFSYLSPWAGLYRRVEEPLAETVRRYDRAWWRQRREVNEVRGSLLRTQEELAEAATRIDNRPELLAELDRKNEELLRLRDLLIGRDAELGAARGQLAVMHHRSLRVAGLAAMIQARVPGAMRILAALRKLTGRRA